MSFKLLSAYVDQRRVVFCTVIASTSTNLFFPQIPAITNAIAAAAEFFRVMDKPSELDPLSDEGLKPDSCVGAIEVESVSFVYPSRPTAPVLQNFSLSIPPGKTTALVGASGSGKSTMIGLLERWYEPKEGCITVDGTNIAKLNTKWLRRQISLVQQVQSH